MVKRSDSRPRVRVTADGTGVAGHAGTRLLADLADGVGLTEALSAAMARTRKRRSKPDPGRVLVDLAVTLADGGDSLSDIKVLREQPDLYGVVASSPTAWRVVASVDEAILRALHQARAKARREAGAAGVRSISGTAGAPCRAPGGDVVADRGRRATASATVTATVGGRRRGQLGVFLPWLPVSGDYSGLQAQ